MIEKKFCWFVLVLFAYLFACICFLTLYQKPFDFISRYFAPWVGIPEDPVTGSAHTVLTDYWSRTLNKTEFFARQCSPRGGDLKIKYESTTKRVILAGETALVLSGQLHL